MFVVVRFELVADGFCRCHCRGLHAFVEGAHETQRLAGRRLVVCRVRSSQFAAAKTSFSVGSTIVCLSSSRRPISRHRISRCSSFSRHAFRASSYCRPSACPREGAEFTLGLCGRHIVECMAERARSDGFIADVLASDVGDGFAVEIDTTFRARGTSLKWFLITPHRSSLV